MDDPEPEIRAAWHEVAGDRFDTVVNDLLLRHGEPHRRYHTSAHVMSVLRHVREICANDAQARTIDESGRQLILAAALFHDAIYNPASATNEDDSARLALAHLEWLPWSDDRRLAVAQLIRGTKDHVPRSWVEAVLFDADLAILGAAPAPYETYVRDVRAEYAYVDDIAWRQGRVAVLDTFLSRPRIYATSYMYDQREARARANLSRERAALAMPSSFGPPT